MRASAPFCRAEAMDQDVQRADEAEKDCPDFLDLVLSEERAARDGRRFRNGPRLSKLPRRESLGLSGRWSSMNLVQAVLTLYQAAPPQVEKASAP